MPGQSSRLVANLLLAAAITSTACAERGAQESAAPRAAYELSEFDAVVQRFVDDEYAKGIAIALVQGDRVEIRGYGEATEDGAAPDAHTLFEIGSVTKLFTSLTLATMVSDGEVALEEPVAKLLPATVHIPDHDGTRITLLSLATHSSGLPAYKNFKPDWDADWLYSFLSEHVLARAPGAQSEYSNLGVALLGHALSVRAEKPYGDLVKERVLVPLGMEHTYVGALPAGERLADGHDGAGAAALPMDLDVFAPAGAIRSDATDMAAFVAANLHPPPLLRAAIVSTHAEHGSHPGGKIALGWMIGLEGLPNARWHNGDTPGYHSFIAIDGERPLGVVVLANTSTRAVDVLGRALLHMLRGEPYDLGLPHLVAVSHEALDRCTGGYEIEPGFVLTITREGGALFAQITGQPKFRVYPSSETTFHYRVDEARLEFKMGADGRANRVVFHTRDQTSIDRIE